MEAEPKALFRKKLRGQELTSFFGMIRDREIGGSDIVFLCIGTDRSTGDALGPIVGTMLQEKGYPHVIGTLAEPIDASNMRERLPLLPEGRCVLAIDACLGQEASVGWYQVSNQPIEPGKSMGKRLPAVGDYSLAAIVNKDSGSKYGILQSTSLYRVLGMAREIVAAIAEVFPLPK